ncbi:hypothetical protein [Aeromonas phage ZPAH34]|nr:hypothetical protein PQD16_gp168 [Aeromonas phage ZPAH34]UOX39515.1 hypothetical protein [Aeromonas phage ZPAH34]
MFNWLVLLYLLFNLAMGFFLYKVFFSKDDNDKTE